MLADRAPRLRLPIPVVITFMSQHPTTPLSLKTSPSTQLAPHLTIAASFSLDTAPTVSACPVDSDNAANAVLSPASSTAASSPSSDTDDADHVFSPITPPTPVTKPQNSPLQLDPLRIAVVDDNPLNLKIILRILEKHLSQSIEFVDTFESGQGVLDALCARVYDIVLLDIDMPEMTGVQVTEHIRRTDDKPPRILAENKNIPLIAVTTNDSDIQRALYDKVGINQCVSKPVSPPILQQAIDAALTSPSSATTKRITEFPFPRLGGESHTGSGSGSEAMDKLTFAMRNLLDESQN